MKYKIIEIKAKCKDHDRIKNILKSKHAKFKGTCHQIDTYFKINSGKLKLREGNKENHLVYYKRENKEGPKQSNVIEFKFNSKLPIKEILTKSLGVLVIVDKKRDIYYINNVKFHLDIIKNLGKFFEIEALDNRRNISKKKLLKQCNFFLDLFNIPKSDLISVSYSDLLLKN